MCPPTPARRQTQKISLRREDTRGEFSSQELNGALMPSQAAFSPFAGRRPDMCPPTPARRQTQKSRSRREDDSLMANQAAFSPLAGPAVVEMEQAQRGMPKPIFFSSGSGNQVEFQKGASLGGGQHMTVHPVIAEKPLFPGYSNDEILVKFYKDDFSEAKVQSFIDNSLKQYNLSVQLNNALLDIAMRGMQFPTPKAYESFRKSLEPLVGYPIVKILNAETAKKDRFLLVEKVPHEFVVDGDPNAKTLAALPQGHAMAQVKRFMQISYDPLDYIASQIDSEFYEDFKENYHPYIQSGNYESFKERFDSNSPLDAHTLFFGALKDKFYPYLKIANPDFYVDLKELYPDAQKSNFRIREDGTVVLIDFMEHKILSGAPEDSFAEALLQNCLTTFTQGVEDSEAVYRYLMPTGWIPSFERSFEN